MVLLVIRGFAAAKNHTFHCEKWKFSFLFIDSSCWDWIVWKRALEDGVRKYLNSLVGIENSHNNKWKTFIGNSSGGDVKNWNFPISHRECEVKNCLIRYANKQKRREESREFYSILPHNSTYRDENENIDKLTTLAGCLCWLSADRVLLGQSMEIRVFPPLLQIYFQDI